MRSAIRFCLYSITLSIIILATTSVSYAQGANVVISQVYGGSTTVAGGSYKNDFVELFNRGNNTVNLNGWSIQYTSPTGTGVFGSSSTNITPLPDINIAPGQYILIQGAAPSPGTPAGADLPTPDVTDANPIDLGGINGKVALVRQSTSLPCNGGSDVCTAAEGALIEDLVGYGTANFSEGGAPAPATSTTTADKRKSDGCQDTNNNLADFTTGTPTPRNSSSARKVCTQTGNATATVLIMEFRFNGAALGGSDEFVELYNNTDATLDISGYTLQANEAGVTSTKYTAPGLAGSSTTTIPARGHFLIVGATYPTGEANLYPAGPGTTAIGDGTLTSPIADDAGIAIMNGTTKIDAVGFTGTLDTTFREGTGFVTFGADSDQYSIVRKFNITTGVPQDTGDNSVDFVGISTTSTGLGPTTGGTNSRVLAELGAPGPENLSSPTKRSSTDISASTPAGCAQTARDTSAVGTNADAGTLVIRRRYTNNTGAAVTKLRFRVIDITTKNSRKIFDAAQGDIRLLSSSAGTPCGADAFEPLTLETPPTQAMGGGRNSTVVVGTLALPTPVPAGESVNVEFKLGVVTGGTFRFVVIIEAN
jgi:hypothetical protein